MADYGNEYEQGAVAITTLVVGPPVTMLALGATGQSPINWSLLGAVLPIILGILLGNCFPIYEEDAHKRSASNYCHDLLCYGHNHEV